ncbi:MAG: metal ABC transporter solute-binding protein, Zn/Mn family [Spirochaetaceae bacterium]
MSSWNLRRPFWLALVSLFCLPGFALAEGSQESAATEQESSDGLTVFVSVLPQTYFVERIGGETVEVTALVPPGRGPATYEPSPRQVTALAKADAYFSIGVPFEAGFLPRIRENLPELLIVDSARNVEKRYLESHDHEHEEEHGHDHEQDHDHDRGEPDPHVWLGPEEVLQQIAVIRDTLIELDPAKEELYRDNHDEFAREIRALEEELREKFAPLRGETFYVYHPAFGYFADAFGLEQVAIETGGDEPTPAQLQRIISRAREDEVKVIFVQPQFSQTAADRAAEAIEGEVVSINPLSPDWFETMRAIAEALEEGL